jgi:hypothetical protein
MTVIARVIANRIYHFVIAMWSAKEAKSTAVKYWEIIADNLSKAGWSWGRVSGGTRHKNFADGLAVFC